MFGKLKVGMSGNLNPGIPNPGKVKSKFNFNPGIDGKVKVGISGSLNPGMPKSKENVKSIFKAHFILWYYGTTGFPLIGPAAVMAPQTIVDVGSITIDPTIVILPAIVMPDSVT